MSSAASVSTMSRPFHQVDVFGTTPFSGNPLAVVSDADGLTTTQMKAISSWTNLSECTFLLPPTTSDADYRVRIFNLDKELDFAGHPTLGSAYAWLAAGGKSSQEGVVVQECGVGLIPVRYDDNQLAFAAPPLLQSGPVDPEFLDQVCGILGLGSDEVVESSWIDNGPGWVGVLLESADTVLSLAPDISRYSGEDSLDIGVIGPYPEGSEARFELRAFFSDASGQLREDPVTGSLNASAAQWLVASGRATPPYVASQGKRVGRTGRVTIDAIDDDLWIGGQVTIAITGTIETPF